MKAIYLIFFLFGCGLDNTPPVYVISDNPDLARKSVEAWGNLGFIYSEDNLGLGNCDRTWYSDTFESDCQITIQLKLVDGLTDDDVNGAMVYGRANQDNRVVEINTVLHGVGLEHTAIHEMGHILLDSMHLDSYPDRTWGNDGVMSSQYNNYVVPTSDDYALACHTIGVCY